MATPTLSIEAVCTIVFGISATLLAVIMTLISWGFFPPLNNSACTSSGAMPLANRRFSRFWGTRQPDPKANRYRSETPTGSQNEIYTLSNPLSSSSTPPSGAPSSHRLSTASATSAHSPPLDNEDDRPSLTISTMTSADTIP